MLLCKQEEAGVQLNAEQADWKDDTDDEPDDQALEVHYMYMVQIQEVTSDAADNSRPIFYAEPLQKVQNDDNTYNVFDNDQEHPEQPESDDTDDLAKERDLLASLIEKLKCEIDDSKNRCYNDNLALMLALESDETIRLAQESRSKLNQVVKCERLEKELSKSNITSKSFEALQKHAINLELALQQYSLAKTDFSRSKSVTTNNVSNDFSKPVTAQILPQNVISILKNTNVITPRIYKVHTRPNQTRTPQLPQDIRKTNKRVSFSTGVIPTTSISRPQLKSNQLEDRVMPNNSQGKKQEVEDHHKNFKFSNNKTFVTACNDSLNAKTSNVNFVCVTYGKCVLNDNHDMCVLVGNTKSVSHFQVVTSLSS
ncbi:hypothetical protein Tco_0065596 [Tanacetum coccineum]